MKVFKRGKLHFLKLYVDTKGLAIDEYIDRSDEINKQLNKSPYKFTACLGEEEHIMVYLKLEEPIFIFKSEMLSKISEELNNDIKKYLSLSFWFDINQSFRRGNSELRYL